MMYCSHTITPFALGNSPLTWRSKNSWTRARRAASTSAGGFGLNGSFGCAKAKAANRANRAKRCITTSNYRRTARREKTNGDPLALSRGGIRPRQSQSSRWPGISPQALVRFHPLHAEFGELAAQPIDIQAQLPGFQPGARALFPGAAFGAQAGHFHGSQARYHDHAIPVSHQDVAGPDQRPGADHFHVDATRGGFDGSNRPRARSPPESSSSSLP